MFHKHHRVSPEDCRELGSSFAELIVRSKMFLQGSLHVHVIVSPTAGFFRHPLQVQETLSWLRMIVLDTAMVIEPNPDSRISVHVGQYKGHPAVLAGEIAESLILQQGIDKDPSLHCILSLGGDGTHQEILNALVELPPEVLEKILVFRLPLGTGNDGADVADIAAAAKVLLQGCDQEMISAIRIQPSGFKSVYAFNIASFGMDAFVTHTANQLKTRFNTDIYRKIADISVLIYPFLFPAKPVVLEIRGKAGERDTSEGLYVLIAFGVSGHRSYGNHKWILPREANLCAIINRSLPKKIRLKNLLYEGKHIGEPGVLYRKASQIVVNCDTSLYLQYDGEAVRLEPDNFPCTLELVSTPIRSIRPLKR